MRLRLLAAKNLWRNKFRTSLTILGGAMAILTFLLLRTVVASWTAGVEHGAKDRVVVRHKISFVMTLPKRYVDEIKALRGVKTATWANWFGAKNPKQEREFFANIAVDPATLFEVYDELLVPEDQKVQWRQDRTGAIVGDVLAKKFGWKVGDKVVLSGTIFPGNWEFRISGIYTAVRKSVDRSTFFFHWSYLNDLAPPVFRDRIGWVVVRVDDPSRTAELCSAIDKHFDDREIQTVSQSERAFNLSFLGMFSAVLKAIDIVSLAILVIMLLILGNTIAMGVRERTNEYGVLRAIGFSPGHIATMILGEAALTGALGGGLGLLLAYPFIQRGFGRWIEENMGAFFPFFRIETKTAVIALGLTIGLGLLAALPSVIRALRLKVVDALRHIA
jgi:putative ABC transport system permease protein